MAKVAQWRRVLAQLQRAGSYGVERTEFLAPVVVDGGEPILNFPARIQELEAKGFVIGTPSRRHGDCTVYVLHSEPSPKVTPRRVVSGGFVTRFACCRCLATCMTEAEVCGRSYPVLTGADQVVDGCLNRDERELSNAA